MAGVVIGTTRAGLDYQFGVISDTIFDKRCKVSTWALLKHTCDPKT